MKEDCPEGTTYLPFYEESTNKFGRTSSAEIGFACFPDSIIPQEQFICHFDKSW